MDVKLEAVFGDAKITKFFHHFTPEDVSGCDRFYTADAYYEWAVPTEKELTPWSEPHCGRRVIGGYIFLIRFSNGEPRRDWFHAQDLANKATAHRAIQAGHQLAIDALQALGIESAVATVGC